MKHVDQWNKIENLDTENGLFGFGKGIKATQQRKDSLEQLDIHAQKKKKSFIWAPHIPEWTLGSSLPRNLYKFWYKFHFS